MPEPTSKPPRKISLEDLLRLKRHERPGAEHWIRFDRELNEKVWRSLVNPPEERTGWLPSWLFRGLRWMTGGAVAAAAVLLSWPAHNVTPVATPVVHLPAASSAQIAAAPVAPASTPVRIATATPIPDDVISSAKATFAMADLDPVSSPAGNNKVPATLSFSVDAGHERYAGGPLDSVAYVSRLHGSAY